MYGSISSGRNESIPINIILGRLGSDGKSLSVENGHRVMVINGTQMNMNNRCRFLSTE
mgnify:CR=1 FL=1